jgi:hypothetical protein
LTLFKLIDDADFNVSISEDKYNILTEEYIKTILTRIREIYTEEEIEHN